MESLTFRGLGAPFFAAGSRAVETRRLDFIGIEKLVILLASVGMKSPAKCCTSTHSSIG